MLTSQQVRQSFVDFFATKGHTIVASSPMVVKNDPTLMFTNAGMNQFKDIFLGNRISESPRVANSQKCLRVSGKHNDLEEVGHDTYHHTMFEMLGNWSFGDYFKRDAIHWAWELLTEVYKLDADRLYATVFGGDQSDGIEADQEAKTLWRTFLPESRILYGSKKDNFWEMGEAGPCGPCSEIHIDLRNDAERAITDGASLVNQDHPLVVEVWNLVFIQFNRKVDGSLVALPSKHVDTGMGFERLCMAIQGKQSNYDTDVFQPLIGELTRLAKKPYGANNQDDIAFRVVADHLRAVSFSIADGQLPSNVKAGYVIRRILRRAIRYGYTFLNFREPFIHKLVPVLVQQMGAFYPELSAQQSLIERVIAEEEASFLRTLETGISLLDEVIMNLKANHKDILDGETAFELYDTYGFPADLTALILSEAGIQMDEAGFQKAMDDQKARSRDAARMEADDWVEVHPDVNDLGFSGYDHTTLPCQIIKYRRVTVKDKTRYQIVLNTTPFYAEAGGQVGDTGFLEDGHTGEVIPVINTIYENRLILHITEKLPKDLSGAFTARVDHRQRISTARNHTATHLLHHALRTVLGTHVEQKGSLVHPDYLRFDFAHFGKMTQEELKRTEEMVNQAILAGTGKDEQRDIPLEEAKNMGAVSLFGEKYGDRVRVIRFGDSIELCGGTHVHSTGEIGLFKITSEGAIASGIRRIEAITGMRARAFYEEHLEVVSQLKEMVRNPREPLKALTQILEKQKALEEQLAAYEKMQAEASVQSLLASAETVGSIRFIGSSTTMPSASVKDIAFNLKEAEKNLVMVLTSQQSDKATVSVFVSPDVTTKTGIQASGLIKAIAPVIKGGGGGQPFFATAGGKNPAGLPEAIMQIRKLVEESAAG
jgi:alanyl-tRNA synthetase